MSLRTISIGFLTNTKDVHSSVGTMFVCSFPDSQDVKPLQGPLVNKMFTSVYTALHSFMSFSTFLFLIWHARRSFTSKIEKLPFIFLCDFFFDFLNQIYTDLKLLKLFGWSCIVYKYNNKKKFATIIVCNLNNFG